MSIFSTRITIAAPPAQVWKVLAKVERWPEWTPSVRKVERLDSKPFGPGSSFRIEQPRLRPATWTVTEYKPGESFTWVSPNPGVVTTGLHTIEAVDEGSQVTLSIRFDGFLAPLVSLLSGGLVREYLGLQAAGLKARCEGPGPNC